jgi:cobalt-zinc-cadmium efflux system outer membrane protein
VLVYVYAALAATPTLALMAAPAAQSMTMDQAVGIALERNRDIIAARLDVQAAEVERVAARLYPNPELSYTYANIVLGDANTTNPGPRPGAFDQGVQTIAISQVLDVWSKRGARTRAADLGIQEARLQLEDAVREVAHSVRSAFADVLREQSEFELAQSIRARYDETVRLSTARFRAGDISENELRKIELESLKYRNAEIDADLELRLARNKFAALLGFGPYAALPSVAAEGPPERAPLLPPALVERALRERPDLRAARAGRQKAEASLRAARREALPDPQVGVAYTHDDFQVSGDNPNTLALTLSLPLPVFDRNQAGIGKANVEMRRNENTEARLLVEIERDVADAVRRAERARALLDALEGGMLARADAALRAAEKSYKAGAISLLELLEAQRTWIETQAQHLRTQYDYRQAAIDVAYAVGGSHL